MTIEDGRRHTSELPSSIEVPDDKGHVSTLPFKACTVDQMRKAIQRRRKPASSKPLPPELEARAEQYREAVLARFPKGKGTRVKVGVRNEKGTGVLDFTGIPVDQVNLLRRGFDSRRLHPEKPGNPLCAPLAPLGDVTPRRARGGGRT